MAKTSANSPKEGHKFRDINISDHATVHLGDAYVCNHDVFENGNAQERKTGTTPVP